MQQFCKEKKEKKKEYDVRERSEFLSQSKVYFDEK